MKITDRAHSSCQFVAVLKIWSVCKENGAMWTYEYLKNMAARARRASKPKKARGGKT